MGILYGLFLSIYHHLSDNTKKHNLRLLNEHPLVYNSYPTDATPLYWPLPRHLLGDRIASYDGYIRFKVAAATDDDNRRDGGARSTRPDSQYFGYYPQVMICFMFILLFV